MTRLILVGALFALAGASAAHAAPPKTPLPSVDIPYEKHVLPNGLTLIVHEDHKAPIVAVNLWYHVGSKDERPGRTGFAHLFEHLMFNGSEHHDDEFFRPLEAAGATKMNGTTWLDRTNYFQNVPTSALDLVLWLESDRMGHLLGAIDQKKLDEQRGVVLNEKRQGENQPYGKADELIAAGAYPAGHPYSWLSIGSTEDLNAASLDDVKEWFRTYYGAANAVLVIAGDVQPAEVRRKVEHYFGDIPAGPQLKRHQTWIAKMSGEKRATLEDRVPQARIHKVWNIPGFATHDFALLEVASNVLAGSKNSRLYKRLVHTDQVATSVAALVSALEIGSQLQVVATVKQGGDARVVEKILDEEIARFLREGPTAAELERARVTRYSNFVRGVERIDGFSGKSAVLAEGEVLGGSPEFYKQQLAWMDAATPRDIRDAAQRWMSDGVFVLNVQPVPEYKTASAGADRSKPPAVGAPADLQLPKLQRATLSNGLKVLLAERRNAPVVHMILMVNAGFAADSLATPGASRLTLAMIDEGTPTRSSLEIANRAELLGARLSAGSTQDLSLLSLNALTAQLDGSLELFGDVLLHPTFPQPDFERLQADTLATIEQEKVNPYWIARRSFNKLIYGDGHAYGAPSTGDPQSVSALTRADLQKFYATWMRPDNATLLIVGDTTLEGIRPLLERHLGAWQAPAAALPQKKLPTLTRSDRQRVFLIDRPGSEQSMVLAGHLGPTRADGESIPAEALNTILGGSFLSRLNMNLREDKHWAYSAGSEMLRGEGQGTFAVNVSVQTDRTAESMQEIVKELRDIRGARQPTQQELEHVQATTVAALPGNNETVNEVARSFMVMFMNGWPDSYWNDMVRTYRGLTPADLQPVANRLIHPDALTWVIVGDVAKIEESVRRLELGEVRVLDVEGNVLR
jgi:zinc protease